MKVGEAKDCIELFENKVKTSQLLDWSGVPRSSFYYRPKAGKRGTKPSTHTPMQDGESISNQSVVIAIHFILSEEFVCFGYQKMTADLRQQGMIIMAKGCMAAWETERHSMSGSGMKNSC